MKRLAIACSIMALLGIFSLQFTAFAQLSQLLHENPGTAKDSSNAVTLLLTYSDTFDLITSRQYDTALELLDELGHADIPDDLRYVADNLNDMCNQFLRTLHNMEAPIDEASYFFAHNQLDETKQKLDEAESQIPDAQFLMQEIEVVNDALSAGLGVFAPTVSGQLKQAYERLNYSLNRLSLLIEELNQRWQGLEVQHQSRHDELKPIKLSLSATPTSILVGDSIQVFGRLSIDDKPLAGRRLHITLNNERLVSIMTNNNGFYFTRLFIPYKYISQMTLKAVYIPEDVDLNIHQTGESLPVEIYSSFYPASLDVSIPDTAFPGLILSIDGQVSYSGRSTDCTIKIWLDNSLLHEEIVRGPFTLEPIIPQEISAGAHRLNIVVSPDKRYAGAYKSFSVNISKLPVQADVLVPQFNIFPNPLKIQGKVYSEAGPVKDAYISFKLKDSSTTARTAADGSFAASLSTFGASLFSSQQLSVTIKPVEAWYSPLNVQRPIFSVNAIAFSLMLAALGILGLMLWKLAKNGPNIEQAVSQFEPMVPSIGTLKPVPTYLLSEAGGTIFSSYKRSLKTIEKAADITMAPHTTLREFLQSAAITLPRAVVELFTALTSIAEAALYSGRKPGKSTASRAEKLAESIDKELHSETP
ncbi:DUF4129 domain-containing protein [Chloroflexota bacterium]